jgi:glycosyltransferase involved in cell wall biosynthesis
MLIGPATPEPGGTTVSFRHLRHALCSQPQTVVTVLDSYGIRGSGIRAPLRLLRLLRGVVLGARRHDVISLHAMPTALPYVAWFLPLIAKLYGKPLIYRSFGGMYYDELSWPKRMLARHVLRRANVVLLQTRELMEKAACDRLRRVEWFPTARPMPAEVPLRTGSCRRFAYVGHLKVTKGLQYLVRAAELLPSDASLDVYGPWYDLPRNAFNDCRKVRYRGVLDIEEVVPTLRNYDALVFPTFMPEEGHSGIIPEAYAAGIPVIATRWKALPEIVEDGVTGLLVEPQDSRALLDAMLRLYDDAALYRRLVAGTQAKRKQFSLEEQVGHFLRICRELAAMAPFESAASPNGRRPQ